MTSFVIFEVIIYSFFRSKPSKLPLLRVTTTRITETKKNKHKNRKTPRQQQLLLRKQLKNKNGQEMPFLFCFSFIKKSVVSLKSDPVSVLVRRGFFGNGQHIKVAVAIINIIMRINYTDDDDDDDDDVAHSNPSSDKNKEIRPGRSKVHDVRQHIWILWKISVHN